MAKLNQFQTLETEMLNTGLSASFWLLTNHPHAVVYPHVFPS